VLPDPGGDDFPVLSRPGFCSYLKIDNELAQLDQTVFAETSRRRQSGS
jgi:hypothetical protein